MRAFPAPCLGSRVELALIAGLLVIHPWECESRRAHGLTSSDTFQAHIQAFHLSYPNIYLMDELLDSMTWGNNI